MTEQQGKEPFEPDDGATSGFYGEIGEAVVAGDPAGSLNSS